MSAPSSTTKPSTANTTSAPTPASGPQSSAVHRAPEPTFAPEPEPADEASLDADTLRALIERLVAADDASEARSPEILREKAWAMHCEGMRSPAIARELDVPERTVREWIAATRDELAAELGDRRAHQRLVTLDALDQAMAAAWDGFHDEREIDRALMHPTLDEAEGFGGPAAGEDGRPRTPLWLRRSGAPRYLVLVVSIQKELIRLLDLRAEAAATFRPAASSAGQQTQENEMAAKTAKTSLADAPAAHTAPQSPQFAPAAKSAMPPASQSPHAENAARSAIPSPSQPAELEDAAGSARPFTSIASGSEAPRPTTPRPVSEAPTVASASLPPAPTAQSPTPTPLAQRLRPLPERPGAADRALLREFDRLMTLRENPATSARPAPPTTVGPASRRPGAAATPTTAAAPRERRPIAAAS